MVRGETDAVDDVTRPEMASETRDMVRLLEAALDAGDFGLSAGLKYPPEHHESEEEIIELCRSTRRALRHP